MITRDTIDKILQTANIYEVISDFIQLKKRGVNYLGNCPFHHEKSPSFTVSPVKEIYKCFGCGKSGNAVGFVMEHEGMSYPEALKYLAAKYHIEIEEVRNTPEQEQQKTEKDSLYILLAAAQKHFAEVLHNDEEGKTIGLSYFKERGLSAKSIEDFGLGWAQQGKDTFTQWALKNGFLKEQLTKTGLSFETDDGHLLDRFRERILFPIHSVSGKVVGFGGRTLKTTGKEAKYINSPETDVYQKSKILYGISQAKKAIRIKDECILVEGYMDVISMYQRGVENVVASSGTSLTEDQLKLVKRFTDNIIFLFDGDDAGQKAALRGIDLALEQGLNVRLVTLPADKDPDSFAREFDAEEIQEYFNKNAKDFVRFKADALLKDIGSDIIRRSEVIREVMQSVEKITDPVARSLFVREAEKIFGVDEKFLYEELQRISVKKFKDENKPAEINVTFTQPPQPKPINVADVSIQEKQLIKDIILYGSKNYNEEETITKYILSQLPELEWVDKICEKIFNEIKQVSDDKNEVLDFTHFVNTEDTEMQFFVTTLVMESQQLDKGWDDFLGRHVDTPEDNFITDVENVLNYLKLHKIIIMLPEVGNNILKAVQENNEEDLLHWQEIKMDLNRTKIEICKTLGISIIPEDNSWKKKIIEAQSSSPD
ncbi:MAG: DNA primase [Bacteroidetes bacterium]|nr:DNA primase [Bacteroidota bacterium]